MTDSRTPPPIPFETFLELLRSRGFAVGLHEHLAIGRLLARWDGTNAGELGQAIAALVSRNEEEVARVERLFVETYLTLPAAPVETGVEVTGVTSPGIRRYVWVAAVAAALILALLSLRRPDPPAPLPRPDTDEPIEVRNDAGTALGPVVPPPPPAPETPAAPAVLETRPAGLLSAAVFLVALAAFWALAVAAKREEWLRKAWASALAALPGPYHFPFVIRASADRLPRAVIEDAANILGHAYGNLTLARQLDVVRTVRQTLRNGSLATFVFRRRRSTQALLVLQDVSADMRMWRGKVDAFVADVRRQGIPIERHYFDGDLRRVATAPHRATMPLERLLQHHPDAPVLVLSDGAGLPALFEAASTTDAWYLELSRRDRRTWVTPVSDDRLWPDEFARLPCAVWPMTAWGLEQAANELAGRTLGMPEHVRVRALRDGRVSEDGLERLKRLASLVPYPSIELLEVLRRQFAPDVSDAVLLHMVHAAGRSAAPIVRLDDDEIVRCLAAIRFETPRLESRVRHALLDVLAESEPADGSAAHERWRIASAVHRLALARLGEGDLNAATATIAELGAGPMWEEVRRITGLTPDSASLDRRPEAGMTASRLHITPDDAGAPPSQAPPGAARMPWAWPGLREALPAAAVAVILVGGAWMFGALPVRALSHVLNSYELSYQQGDGAGALRLERPATVAAIVPARADVYRDGLPFRSQVDVSSGAASIALSRGDLGYYYQARAPLPEGNLALSDPVWVPGERVVVLIDAMPWAHVTIVGDEVPSGAQTTPFSAALKPGEYQLRFENGGLTPPMEQNLTVPEPGVAGTRSFRFTMPGFDASQTATDLSRGAATAR